MSTPILGLHHVTATVSDAQQDLDFYVGLLGLRLVKRTVNFDNHGVYHFYYGDERGTPSTIMTTFPYAGHRIRVGSPGAGQVTVTSFSVPAGALDYWRRRFESRGVSFQDESERFGEESIRVRDPSGLIIGLVGVEGDERVSWVAGEIEPDAAIRGVHSVTLSVRRPGPTLEFLADALGFEAVAESGARTRVAVGGGGPGKILEVLADPDGPAGVGGMGTVHHVALAIGDEAEQRRIREELIERGRHVTGILDRKYFTSIYFREPGAILYEIATIGPGFTIDEPPAELGTSLQLPPWEEPHRASIEAQLPEITVPGVPQP